MNEFLRCLNDLDAKAARAIWAQVRPKALQPADDEQMLIMLHRARTESPAVDEAGRLYSHAWLVDRSIPSGLPDELRPKAERLYPRTIDAVGVSVNFSSPALKPAADIIGGAISDVIEDAYAEGRTDPGFVKLRMREAREIATKQLFGRWMKP